jgi:hypothetical protein
MNIFTESIIEQAALAWLEATGWRVAHGPEITSTSDALIPTHTPSHSHRERESYRDVVLFVNGLPLAVKVFSSKLNMSEQTAFSRSSRNFVRSWPTGNWRVWQIMDSCFAVCSADPPTADAPP